MEVLQRTANRGSISTGFDIANSLKFENDNSEGLVNNYSGDGTPTKFTFSSWVKRTEIDADTYIFAANYSNIRFISGNWIRVEMYTGSATYYYDTAALYRDTSAFYHIVFQYDSTQGTAANRTKLWVNGVLNASFGQYDTHTNLPQNATIGFGEASSNFQVGYNFVGGSNWKGYCGYMAELHYTDGVVNDADAFGEYDDDSGIWIPKAYTGSHGSKGIYLKFNDSSDLGKNSASGGVGDFSLTNITAADQATDTPTNNFATAQGGLLYYAGTTKTEGATAITRTGSSASTSYFSTMAVSSGKWYAEFKKDGTTKELLVGIADSSSSVFTNGSGTNVYVGSTADSIGLYGLLGMYAISASFTDYSPSFSTEIISLAVNMDDRKIHWAINNTWVASTDPTSSSSGLTIPATIQSAWLGFNLYTVGETMKINYGGYTTMSISSAASDANGYGTFEYAPPNGYFSLCTQNLSELG